MKQAIEKKSFVNEQSQRLSEMQDKKQLYLDW